MKHNRPNVTGRWKFLTLLCLALPLPLVAGEKLFPPDANILNVKSPPYNARGDGITDDTFAVKAAIKDAINNQDRYVAMPFIYFPSGTYIVSDSLENRVATNGYSYGWRSGMILVGQNDQDTVIRLQDNAPGFGDPLYPKAVIRTGSETNAGWDAAEGLGGSAFRHSIINLTVDTGSGNPGAIGIDYKANNRGVIEDVNVRCGNGIGICGISMNRYAPGPAMLKRVRIDGFNTGFSISQLECSITIEHLTLVGQNQFGLDNYGNVVNVRNLVSTNTVPVLRCAHGGLITLLDGLFSGGASTNVAITNNAKLYLRNITSSGYGRLIDCGPNRGTNVPANTDPAFLPEYITQAAVSLFPSPATALHLPIEETPEFHTNDLSQWANVVTYGATPNNTNDNDAPAIQAAIDSGHPIVYLPRGRYHISQPLFLRGSVRKFTGMQSSIATQNGFTGTNLIYFSGGTAPFCVMEHLYLDGGYIHHCATNTLAMRHLDFHNGGYCNNSNGIGNMFLEDTIGKPVLVHHPQNLWARQLNTEGSSAPAFVENHGGTVWIFGHKTERPTTVIKTYRGRTELLGALFYSTIDVPADATMFISVDSEVSYTYLMTQQNWPLHLIETRNGVTRRLYHLNNLHRGTPLYAGYPVRGLYFEWDPFPPTQMANVPFPATLLAKTENGKLATDYNATAYINGWTTNGGYVSVTPYALPLVNGVWTGFLNIIQTSGPTVLLAADSQSHSGYSSPISFLPANDLQLTLTASTNALAIGERLTYTILLTNTGPLSATGLRLTNVVSPAALLVSANASQGSCSVLDNVVTCDLGDLGATQTLQIELVASPLSLGALTNSATVTRSEADSVPANNSATVIATVTMPRLSIDNVAIPEGDSGTTSAQFNVTLWPPATNTVTCRYLTLNNTATCFGTYSDYLNASGLLTFPPGATHQSISITIRGDTLAEFNESFYVYLMSATNASIAINRGIGTILNDDSLPSVAISDVTLTEDNTGATNAIFQVWLSHVSGMPVSIDYITANGTAEGETDYVPRSGTLVFPAETLILTQAISIPIRGDTLVESSEIFYVRLANPTNAHIARHQGTGTVLNDDPETVFHHLAWAPLAFLQPTNTPISVALTARNYLGEIDPLSAPLTFSAWSKPQNPTLLGEVHPNFAFTGGNYTVGYAFTPTQNLLITHLRHFSGNKVSLWTENGQVLFTQPISGPPGQWTATRVTTNLQLRAGTTYRLGFYGGNGAYYALDTIPAQFSCGHLGDSYFGIGDAFPNFRNFDASHFLVDLVYVEENLAVQFNESAALTNGLWTGEITFREPATNLVLFAEDASGHIAISSAISAGDASDYDGNGLPDLWESSHFGGTSNPNGDPDADSATNLAEYLAGTDPVDPASSLRPIIVTQGDFIYITVPTALGKHYQLESTASLPTPSWEPIEDEFIGDGFARQFKFANDGPMRFWRVRLMP